MPGVGSSRDNGNRTRVLPFLKASMELEKTGFRHRAFLQGRDGSSQWLSWEPRAERSPCWAFQSKEEPAVGSGAKQEQENHSDG